MLKNKKKTEKLNDKKLDFPFCYGNFCQKHVACHNCLVKNDCKEIPLPKEPLWCNYD